MNSDARRFWTDVGIAAALAAVPLLLAARLLLRGTPPFEDAAMLMRYAQHLAQGHGIVWNVGEAPMDGATDFLFMVAVSALVRLGAGVEAAVRGLGLAAHVLTVIVVYAANRRLNKAGRLVSAAAALYLTAGPALTYVAAYFGTSFFACMAALAWCAALALLRPAPPPAAAPLFAVAGLLTGLARPEGVILVGLMALAVVAGKGPRNALAMLVWLTGSFGLLGTAFFVWRWHYFGHPLPNPFYVKASAGFQAANLAASFLALTRLAWPLLLLLAVSAIRRGTVRSAVCCAIPVVGLTASFGMISEAMNFAGRYQYAAVPILLIACGGWLAAPRGASAAACWSGRLRGSRAAIAAGGLAAIVAIAWQAETFLRIRTFADGRYEVGRLLRAYRDRGYTVATSEAGLIPLYSDWRSIDTWGLNDAWIARHGLVTEAYLDRCKPEVVAFHAFFSPVVPPDPRLAQSRWCRMVQVLKDYAERRGYILAAAYADDPRHAHYYYVSPHCPDRRAIVDGIRAVDYAWFGSGRPCRNFAQSLETQTRSTF